MINKKKIIINATLFISVFILTIYAVFRGKNLKHVGAVIGQCNYLWLIPAVLCVLFFIYGESFIIWHMLKSCGIFVKRKICFLFSSVGFFFSCVTPSATGGQPMQLYFMKKEKIPVPVATVILMVITITYKMVLVFIGIGIPFFASDFLEHYLGDLLFIYDIGLTLNIVFVLGLIMMVFHPTLAKRMMMAIFGYLEKCHILKHKEGRLNKLEKSMNQYNATAAFVKENKKLMVQVFVITLIQRIAMFAVTYFVYRAFSLKGTFWLAIVFLQATISVAVDMLPLPGGMGISETMFLSLFGSVFGEKFLVPGLVLSRGLSYYSELLISAIFTLVAVAYFSLGAKKQSKCRQNSY